MRVWAVCSTYFNALWAMPVTRVMHCVIAPLPWRMSMTGQECYDPVIIGNMFLIVTRLLLVVTRNQGQLQGQCLISAAGCTCWHMCHSRFILCTSAIKQSAGVAWWAQIKKEKKKYNLGQFKENNLQEFLRGPYVSIWTLLKNEQIESSQPQAVEFEFLRLAFWWINKKAAQGLLTGWINLYKIHQSCPLGQK